MARVVVTGTMVATFAGVEGSGRSFRMDQAVIAHLRDGSISEAWEIADVAALELQVTRRNAVMLISRRARSA
jgi:ketosteroid isomerase-like protein